jgi:hypothetical protein
MEAHQFGPDKPCGGHRPADLKAKALAALHRLQKLPHLVQGFFQDPSLRYITA